MLEGGFPSPIDNVPFLSAFSNHEFEPFDSPVQVKSTDRLHGFYMALDWRTVSMLLPVTQIMSYRTASSTFGIIHMSP